MLWAPALWTGSRSRDALSIFYLSKMIKMLTTTITTKSTRVNAGLCKISSCFCPLNDARSRGDFNLLVVVHGSPYRCWIPPPPVRPGYILKILLCSSCRSQNDRKTCILRNHPVKPGLLHSLVLFGQYHNLSLLRTYPSLDYTLSTGNESITQRLRNRASAKSYRDLTAEVFQYITQYKRHRMQHTSLRLGALVLAI